MKFAYLLGLVFLCTPFYTSRSWAQDASDGPGDAPSTDHQVDLDASEAKFRKLICERAADFDSEEQAMAIQILANHGYRDERFDVALFAVVRQCVQNNQWDNAKIENLIRLMPSSTLEPGVRAKLLLDCFVKCDQVVTELRANGKSTSKTRSQLSSLLKELRAYPEELGHLLKTRLAEPDCETVLLDVVLMATESRKELLPVVMKVAESSDKAKATKSLFVASELIRNLRKEEQTALQNAKRLAAEAAKNPAAVANAPAGPVDDRYLSYAQRIVDRYDKNGDSVLVTSEYEKMLMTPKPADFNRDNRITVDEYARYLQSRTTKNRN